MRRSLYRLCSVELNSFQVSLVKAALCEAFGVNLPELNRLINGCAISESDVLAALAFKANPRDAISSIFESPTTSSRPVVRTVRLPNGRVYETESISSAEQIMGAGGLSDQSVDNLEELYAATGLGI